jgi:hypothetical protein
VTQEQKIWIALGGEVLAYLLVFAFLFRTWRRERRAYASWASNRTTPETDQKEYEKMTAKLPEELIEEKQGKLVELANGTSGYVRWTTLVVSQNRDCFLDAAENLMPHKSMFAIEVRRDHDGGFHVTIPSDCTYKPVKITNMPAASALPVVSITIGPPAIEVPRERK